MTTHTITPEATTDRARVRCGLPFRLPTGEVTHMTWETYGRRLWARDETRYTIDREMTPGGYVYTLVLE
jgi:hypothetical protein